MTPCSTDSELRGQETRAPVSRRKCCSVPALDLLFAWVGARHQCWLLLEHVRLQYSVSRIRPGLGSGGSSPGVESSRCVSESGRTERGRRRRSPWGSSSSPKDTLDGQLAHYRRQSSPGDPRDSHTRHQDLGDWIRYCEELDKSSTGSGLGPRTSWSSLRGETTGRGDCRGKEWILMVIQTPLVHRLSCYCSRPPAVP